MMRTNRLALFAIVLLLVGPALAVAAAAADQHSGTWKMNPAKSKYSPGPAPTSTTLTVEADENGIKVNVEGTNADGTPLHVQYDAKFDGKDYPVTGVPYADTVSVKRIDASTIESSMKKAGQVVMTVTSKLSKDGKTRTSTFKGKDAQGHAVLNVVVSDKQ
jgi:formylglycine-generating enzyme required for sulfatase activity